MNNDHEQQNIEQTIREQVLVSVKSGRVRVRPKAYFILRAGGVIALATLVLVLSVFVVSFIFFSIYESGEQFLLGFGRQGIMTFFALFPWVLMMADIASIIFLEWLIRGFKLGYRISLLNIFAGTLLLSIVFGAAVNVTPLHRVLLYAADQNTLPFIGELYESIRDSHTDHGVFRGTIVVLQDGDAVISHNDTDHDTDDGTWTVIIPSGAPALHVGDRIYVFGTARNDIVEAKGIEKLSPDQ